RTPGPHALPRPDRGNRLGPRRGPRLPERTGRLLAGQVRLAGPGAEAERATPVRDRGRRPGDPLRPPALEGEERFAAGPGPRLAGVVRRVSKDHRAAHRSGGARRQGGGRLSRRVSLAARLRLLGKDARARLELAAHGG